jgi:thiosulfate/3-mercaptopyruvate sulfurtransferase
MILLKKITTQQLSLLLNYPSHKIIDIRPIDAYNGWCLQNEPRGGHIKGAKSIPYKWTNYIEWIEIVKSKRISLHDHIILYGYSITECEKTAQLFNLAGYRNVSVYFDFLTEWIPNKNLPLEKLERHKNLVPVEWVNKVINGEDTELPPNENVVICHAHYRNRNAYLSGHIPGAIDIDTLELECSQTWNRRSAKELKESLQKHGITTNTTVILYGKFMWPDNNDDFPGSAAGHLGAIRCAFIMLYAGVKDVRVINGGFQSWKDAGFEISCIDEKKRPVKRFGVKIPTNPKLAVDTPEAKKMIESNNADIVCVRSWPEYLGEVSGYNYIDKKGRIPGTIYGFCGSDAYHMENYRNLDHTTREFHEIEAQWLKAGITPNKHLAFYCGTGWRGSEAFYNAWLMGWPNISVYDGGWYEWSNDPNNPIEMGLPEKASLINP